MKFKKFISKLQSHEYELWIMKRHFTVYDGSIKDLPVSDIYNQKIKSFYFSIIDGKKYIVINLK